MIKDADLVDMALSISAAGGAIADAVKKAIFHGHGVDWPQLLTLAEVVRINTATLALLAEQQIDRAAQPALDFGDMRPGDVAEQCAMCDTAGVGRLSNVTIGPGAP